MFAGEYGAKRLADLKLRVVEHNVLVVTKYYTRISTTRLAELLDLKPEEVRVWVLGGVCVGGGR
jgi:26S proteasome regulatory subunit N5